jgi:glycosyltransferase involved in cell wall biosynthesis
MKLLIVSDAWHPQVNGVVRTYEGLIPELKKMGHEVRVIGPSDFPLTMPMPSYPEIKLAILPYARLRKMIDAYKPDSIHVATEGPLGQAAVKYCKKHKAGFSSSYHTHFPDYVAKRLAKPGTKLYYRIHELAKKYIRNFHAHSRALMIATQSLEDQLKSWGFTPPIYRLTRGVDLDLFYPGEKTLFKNLKRPVAIYVGRVAVEKSIEDFLEMKWSGSKVVIGHGPDLEKLKTKYPEALFTGVKTGADLAAHYRSADIFVFPSRTDTFGIVLIEALASGIPVAAYDVTGPKDIITTPVLGILGESLSAAAGEALKHGAPDQRSLHVKNYYTWENVARQFMAAIEDI